MCPCLSHQLQNQWLIRSYSSIHSNMFYLGLVFIPQIIEAKAVLFCINDILKCCLQRNALCIIQNAFKYGVLNSSANDSTKRSASTDLSSSIISSASDALPGRSVCRYPTQGSNPTHSSADASIFVSNVYTKDIIAFILSRGGLLFLP